jgi:protein-disulfide isomerase
MLLAAAVTALLLSSAAEAGSDDDTAARLRRLEAQVEALQKRVDTLEARPAAPPPSPGLPVQDAAVVLPVDGSPIKGDKRAPVDLVVFTDFQCPFCARTHPLFMDVLASPQLKGKVRLIYKYFPLSFHKDAKPAALMAMAVRELGGDEAFWRYAGLLFDNQRSLDADHLARLADDAGVDGRRAAGLVQQNAERYEAVLRTDYKVAEKAHVRGTPQIFVGGWELRTRSVDGVVALIKEKHLLP